MNKEKVKRYIKSALDRSYFHQLREELVPYDVEARIINRKMWGASNATINVLDDLSVEVSFDIKGEIICAIKENRRGPTPPDDIVLYKVAGRYIGSGRVRKSGGRVTLSLDSEPIQWTKNKEVVLVRARFVKPFTTGATYLVQNIDDAISRKIAIQTNPSLRGLKI